MNPRSFYKLLIVTTVCLIAAITVWIVTPKYSSGTFFGEPLLPGLIEKINDVEVISIEHTGRTLTFLKDGNGDWTLMEVNGYPADKERIRNALIGLAHLEKIEQKTALPEFYPDLHVEDNSSEKSKSYLVTLLNKEGEKITSLLIGKSISGITWNGQGYFVRFPEDPQSWLVRGNLDVTGDELSWLSTRILPLIKGRASSVTVVDGSKTREIVYSRTDPALPMLPSFMSDAYLITAPDFIKKMEDSLASFEFQSAAPRTASLAQEIPFSSLLIETGDGLNIYLFLYLKESKTYAAVSFASTDKADEETRKEALDLEAFHSKWLYQMSAEKVSPLLPFLSLPEEEPKVEKKETAAKEKKAPAKKNPPQKETAKKQK